MAAEGQADRMASDMEGHLKQKSAVEFLHAEKIAHIDIHQCLLNIYGDQTENVSTVRWWVMCFSNGHSNVKKKFRMAMQIFIRVICRLLFIASENA